MNYQIAKFSLLFVILNLGLCPNPRVVTPLYCCNF